MDIPDICVYICIYRERGREKREKEEKERLCTANINTAFEKIGTNMHTNYTEGEEQIIYLES